CGRLPSGTALVCSRRFNFRPLVAAGSVAFLMLVGCAADDVGSDQSAAFTGTAAECQASGKKTLVCHIPPGNPENAHNICIGNPAVPAHLAHGDHVGSCAGAGGPDAGVQPPPSGGAARVPTPPPPAATGPTPSGPPPAAPRRGRARGPPPRAPPAARPAPPPRGPRDPCLPSVCDRRRGRRAAPAGCARRGPRPPPRATAAGGPGRIRAALGG